MQVNQLKSFDFEGTSLRVFGDTINPLFAVSDVCTALGISNPTMAVSKLADFEKTQIDIGQGPAINAVNESGLYTLILRSRDAVKEGTPAYRFRVKVTAEILPAIRRTGRYEYTDGERNCDQYMIRKAVAKRAKASSVHYQTIYNALYDRFRTSSYKQLRHNQIREALTYIECFQLREPTALPAIPEDLFVMPKAEAVLFANFIYDWKYLFRAELDAVIALLRAVRSPMSGALWDAVHNLNLELLEATLKRHGIEVRKPDQLALWHK